MFALFIALFTAFQHVECSDLHLSSETVGGVPLQILSQVLTCAAASVADPILSIMDTAFIGQLGLLPLASMGPNSTICEEGSGSAGSATACRLKPATLSRSQSPEHIPGNSH